MYYRLEIKNKFTGNWVGIFRGDIWYHSEYPEFKDLMIKLSVNHRNPIQEIREWHEENYSENTQLYIMRKNEFIRVAQTYPSARFYFTEKALEEIGWILEGLSRFPFVRLIETEDLKVLWSSPYEIQILALR